MPTFKRYYPASEKELHGIIEKEFDALEEGLKPLKYEFDIGKGISDFLCVDSGGGLAIIEVKLHEDENILFQTLRYFSFIDKDKYLISNLFKDSKIDPEQEIRIILIAERFSEDIKRLSILVKPAVELYEYTVLESANGEKGITYHPVTIPFVNEQISKPSGIDDHRKYLTADSLKPVFEKIRVEIKGISSDIIEYSTHSYVGYKFRGRQFAWLMVHRKSIDVGAHIIDENKQILDYDATRIFKDKEDYSEAIEKIKKSFMNLGGKLKDQTFDTSILGAGDGTRNYEKNKS